TSKAERSRSSATMSTMLGRVEMGGAVIAGEGAGNGVAVEIAVGSGSGSGMVVVGRGTGGRTTGGRGGIVVASGDGSCATIMPAASAAEATMASTVRRCMVG